MAEQRLPIADAAPENDPLAARLQQVVRGEVRFDRLFRALYATDASIYEIFPRGVVMPRDLDDVVATVRTCHEHGTPLIARGGGTGLAGGAVGSGVQLDFSRYMQGIGPVDTVRRTVEVEAGVVLDELNAHLAAHGLRFAPDVATSSRATIGGMIANNSCGANSVRYGRTVDHVADVTVVLADGAVVRFGMEGDRADRVRFLEAGLGEIRDRYAADIESAFPKILRSNGGYGLDRLGPPGTAIDAVKVLCGSEGTLGVVVRATLRLLPLPKHVALLVLHFRDLLEALATAPAILPHRPAAVELIDRLILDAGRANAEIRKRCHFLSGDPEALLIVELHDDDEGALDERVQRLSSDAAAMAGSFAAVNVPDRVRQADVWKLRTSGLGLLMSRPGDAHGYSFVEDTAVDPARLRDYIAEFQALLTREGVTAGFYAHASVGCIHVKPVLNLKTVEGVACMRRIAEGVTALARRYGGTITGEHGDGLVRSCFLEALYGSRIMQAFAEVKQLFDPQNLLNPNKIVNALPMTEHLRYGPGFAARGVKTHLDFAAHGGMAGMAGMCSGVGQCRQRLVGTMCPSFMATGDERHTTRARANALRLVLSNRGLLNGLDDPALHEVMDLCLSCKACRTECPTGVDMARMKAEYLSRRNLREGVSDRSRLLAEMPRRLAWAARFPRLFNTVAQSGVARAWMEKRYGVDRRVPPPRLARRTFRAWFRGRAKRSGSAGNAPRGRVIYFVDTWTNYVTPEVGVAAVVLLERAGFEVRCPEVFCCGRPAISAGLLHEAKDLASGNVSMLVRAAAGGVPILGTEPSCILTLTDEYPQLLGDASAALVASRTVTMETFLRRLLDTHPEGLRFDSRGIALRYHAHCHQKALVGSEDAVALLQRAFGEGAREIPSGCCGMAGSFGHEVEHYDVARAIGEQRLFPAVRERGDARIAVSGFSCRHQIEHHTGVRARHLVEYLAEALV